MKNLIKKIGRGIAPLVLSGALAFGGCVGNNTEIKGLNGRDTKFSDLDIPTQVEYFFKVPVKENKSRELIGLVETKESYRVVACVPYNEMAKVLTEAKARDAVLETMTGKESYEGYVDNFRIFRSRRIKDIFCAGYTVNKSDIHIQKK